MQQFGDRLLNDLIETLHQRDFLEKEVVKRRKAANEEAPETYEGWQVQVKKFLTEDELDKYEQLKARIYVLEAEQQRRQEETLWMTTQQQQQT